MTLPFGEARALADDARARALALGKALSIAVVDYGGFVVLIERMDGARPMKIDSKDERVMNTPGLAIVYTTISSTQTPSTAYRDAKCRI